MSLLRSLIPALLLAAPVWAAPSLQLGETTPIETTLDDPTIPPVHTIWSRMINGATQQIELSAFYISPKPNGRLEPFLRGLEQAAKRGVKVRIIVDARFSKQYPKPIERLRGNAHITVRTYDMKPCCGGVQHAKYFIVDGAVAWIGSQNFDWRSLEHVMELGVKFDEPSLVGGLQTVFEFDWAAAGGTPMPASKSPPRPEFKPIAVGHTQERAAFVASPNQWLPPGVAWDLPAMTEAIDGAKRRIRIQLLSWALYSYSGERWDDLEKALRRAADRGVKVEMMVGDWSKKPPKVHDIQRLQGFKGITVKFVTIPPWSGGHIPYARVIHSKYLTIDGKWSWIGTSNWSKDYFFASRNVGLIVDGPEFAKRLDRYFQRTWKSRYAQTVDPKAIYVPPKVK